MSAPQINPESPFGKFQASQGEKEIIGRVKSYDNRYDCDVCQPPYTCMSDEALQLHMIGHYLRSLNASIDRVDETIQKLIPK